MKKQIVFVVCVALVLGIASLASATPTQYGPTGLINIPSAQVLSPGQFSLFYGSEKIGEMYGLDVNFSTYGVSAGLGYGVEINGGGYSIGNAAESVSSDDAFFSAKWACLNETATLPALAIGALNVTKTDLFIKDGDGVMIPYIAATKSYVPEGSAMRLVGTVGYLGEYKQFMVGGSVNITPRLALMADYAKDYSNFSYGARYAFDESFRIQVFSRDSRFGGMLSYSFGGK